MEVIAIKNNHRKKEEEKKYGCVCPRCGSVFVFSKSEITVPKMINCSNRDCYVRCPNCQLTITMEKFKEFKNEHELEMFRNQYTEH